MLVSVKWHLYGKKKPEADGYYLCNLDDGLNPVIKYLYYSCKDHKWINKDRTDVFEQYEVYRPCEGIEGEEALERVCNDGGCVVSNVMYWSDYLHV